MLFIHLDGNLHVGLHLVGLLAHVGGRLAVGEVAPEVPREPFGADDAAQLVVTLPAEFFPLGADEVGRERAGPGERGGRDIAGAALVHLSQSTGGRVELTTTHGAGVLLHTRHAVFLLAQECELLPLDFQLRLAVGALGFGGAGAGFLGAGSLFGIRGRLRGNLPLVLLNRRRGGVDAGLIAGRAGHGAALNGVVRQRPGRADDAERQ